MNKLENNLDLFSAIEDLGLTERLKRLKDRYLAEIPVVCTERLQLVDLPPLAVPLAELV